jgi:osmoprotectant transport system substrate-binding protein
MRSIRRAALGATLLALLVGACTSGGSSSTPAASAPASTAPVPSESAATSPSGATLASTLVLGGPPECPQRPFCAVGLEKTYGLTFKEFKPLDPGGPITVQAIKNGTVDVGLLFTSAPAISANGFVLLADDKQLQRADNLVPVVRQAVLDATPGVADLLNPWSAKITQEVLNDLNTQVSVDQKDPKDVAKAWLAANGLTTGTIGAGKTVTVGETNLDRKSVV